MRKGLLILGVIGALAVMPSAHASTEAATTYATSANSPGPATGSHPSSPAHGAPSPTTESAPAADGAAFSPLGGASATPAHRLPATDRNRSAGSADLTLSVTAALAAVAALAYLLRRASR